MVLVMVQVLPPSWDPPLAFCVVVFSAFKGGLFSSTWGDYRKSLDAPLDVAFPLTVIKTNHSAAFFFWPSSCLPSTLASAVSDSGPARSCRWSLLLLPAAGRARLPTRTGHCQELHYSFCFNPLMWIQVAVSVPRLWRSNKWLARGRGRCGGEDSGSGWGPRPLSLCRQPRRRLPPSPGVTALAHASGKVLF